MIPSTKCGYWTYYTLSTLHFLQKFITAVSIDIYIYMCRLVSVGYYLVIVKRSGEAVGIAIPPYFHPENSYSLMLIPHAKSLAQTTTRLPPCVIQIHPVHNLIIVGTYKLEDDGSRNGSLDLYSRKEDGEL